MTKRKKDEPEQLPKRGFIYNSNKQILEGIEAMIEEHGVENIGVPEGERDLFLQDVADRRADFDSEHPDEIFDVEAIDLIGAYIANPAKTSEPMMWLVDIAQIIEKTYRPNPLSTDKAVEDYYDRRRNKRA